MAAEYTNIEGVHGPSPPKQKSSLLLWLRSLSSGAIEAKVISWLWPLLSEMRDDLFANGISQWLFTTADTARVAASILVFGSYIVIHLAFRKQNIYDRHWFRSNLLLSFLVWVVLWVVSPYCGGYTAQSKAWIILFSFGGVAIFFLPGRFSRSKGEGFSLTGMVGALTLVSLVSTGVFSVNWFPLLSRPETSTPEPLPPSDTPTPTPKSTPTPTQTLTPTPISTITHALDRCPYRDQPVPRNSDYVVQPGDCLSCIGDRAGVYMVDLLAANPHKKKNPDLLLVGEIIHIP